jgi:hypothetical protein
MNHIKLFENKHIRTTWEETEGKWYFSVQDVVEVLTDSSDVKQYIKRMLSRNTLLQSNWGTICTPVEMLAADGRIRKIQAADVKGILGLCVYMVQKICKAIQAHASASANAW